MRTPAGRRAAGLFLVEGPQAVGAAAAAGLLLEVYATAEAQDRYRAALPPDLAVTVVAPRTIAGLAGTVNPQGLVGVAPLISSPAADVLRSPTRLVAVLVAVADPGNAGTIVRVADAAGADAVIFAGEPGAAGVDPHNDKCVRASAGSLFHLPIGFAPITEVVARARAAGLQVLAADPHAPLDLETADRQTVLARPTAWLFGNEARGLSAASRAAADLAVRVPLYGRAESLNLATAAAVCLYASARAQR